MLAKDGMCVLGSFQTAADDTEPMVGTLQGGRCNFRNSGELCRSCLVWRLPVGNYHVLLGVSPGFLRKTFCVSVQGAR